MAGSKQNKIVLILIGILLLSLVGNGILFLQLKEEKARTLENSILIDQNKEEIEKLNYEKESLSKDVDALLKERDSLKTLPPAIEEKYHTIYEKIYTSPDSAQLRICKELLSRHKRLPVKRY